MPPNAVPPTKHPGIAYRAHIDGLRGLAVIAVVFYHAQLLGMTGGFIGVDIFFVISGFLIASIVLRDMRAGVFSLGGFWERRIRRILPALFVVMVACAIAGRLFMLYPQDYHHLGNALVAQSVFSSNVLFMLTDNYFDQSSHYSPLLHTWSLSVEEQFYILFPLLVIACAYLARRLWKRRSSSEVGQHTNARTERVLLIAIVIGGVLSFLINIWWVNIAPGNGFWLPFVPASVFWDTTSASAGFYLMFSRAWELALGIVLALTALRIRNRLLAEIVSLGGIVAILAGVFAFNDSMAFPGVAALVPTLGAAAFIVANEHARTKTAAFFSNPVIVWVGLISYSLYLWHWPIFVFAAIVLPAPLSNWTMVGLIALSVLLAWLSYRFVETPFRRKTLIKKRSIVFLCGFAALAAMALLGLAILHDVKDLPERTPAAAEQLLNAGTAAQLPYSYCFQFPGDASKYGGLCRIGDTSSSASPQFVVWGDSHADAMAPMFDTLGKQFGKQGVVFSAGDCIPVAGARRAPPLPVCDQEAKNALQYIEDNNIKTVILVARWSYYVTGGPDGARVGLITDSNAISNSPAQAQAALERLLPAMVRQLTSEGRQVYIMEQVPEQFDFDTRSAFYQAVRTDQATAMHGISLQQNDAYQSFADSVIQGLATTSDVHVADPSKILCPDGTCELDLDGQLLYRDEDHLSVTGATLLSPLFVPLFENMRETNRAK